MRKLIYLILIAIYFSPSMYAHIDYIIRGSKQQRIEFHRSNMERMANTVEVYMCYSSPYEGVSMVTLYPDGFMAISTFNDLYPKLTLNSVWSYKIENDTLFCSIDASHANMKLTSITPPVKYSERLGRFPKAYLYCNGDSLIPIIRKDELLEQIDNDTTLDDTWKEIERFNIENDAYIPDVFGTLRRLNFYLAENDTIKK